MVFDHLQGTPIARPNCRINVRDLYSQPTVPIEGPLDAVVVCEKFRVPDRNRLPVDEPVAQKLLRSLTLGNTGAPPGKTCGPVYMRGPIYVRAPDTWFVVSVPTGGCGDYRHEVLRHLRSALQWGEG